MPQIEIKNFNFHGNDIKIDQKLIQNLLQISVICIYFVGISEMGKITIFSDFEYQDPDHQKM